MVNVVVLFSALEINLNLNLNLNLYLIYNLVFGYYSFSVYFCLMATVNG